MFQLNRSQVKITDKNIVHIIQTELTHNIHHRGQIITCI